ncbi:MAG: choice-of-anchor U domain-containing protein, partial [Mariprofundales bacterium]
GNTPAPAGDGLTLTQKQTLHLDPYSIDTDNDGTPDAEEIGDPANPFDLDGDGVIDALEPSGDSDDYSKAFGMRDQYGNAVGIDSYGNTLTSVSLSPAPATLSKPAGIVSDMISYEARLPSNVYAAVSKFVFSTPLPAVIEPYKVDASGVYTIIPAFNTTMAGEGWMQIDAYTLELTLKDGGVFDQDGVINGIVVDPLVIASGVLVPVAAAALPTLLSPIDKATAVTLDATGGVVLQWTKPVTVSTTATYELLLATDAAFTNVIQTIPVTTIVLASNVMPFMLVGVAFGMLAWYRRRHIVLVVLVLACAALISCSSGGSGGTVPPTTTTPATTAPTITKPAPVTPPVGSVLAPNTQQQTLSGLQAGTTYFWKIVVTEANGATADSQVWSFTTK